eukprot:CAMPEP_0185174672 /NCGR_PEP_ID=MMETSP1139-20130426/25645_1 /TAXON_ID=298111 /ORGANISM="Pavlova sp., Strain CCMP459" /LENGTH=73 /DNA_ID=CAMNT_0027740393 /DNA_START=95 /DNA_END=317 /DNA_ORIENTATION=-
MLAVGLLVQTSCVVRDFMAALLRGSEEEAVEEWRCLPRPALKLGVVLRADEVGVALELKHLHALSLHILADKL